MPYCALDVAQYIIDGFSKKNIAISNLKLQTLLFFAQSKFFSVKNDFLFTDTIEAWSFGPVIPKVYHAYRENNFEGLGVKNTKISKSDISIINLVINEQSKYTTSMLIGIIRNHPIWLESYKRGKHSMITKSKLKKYFSSVHNF